MREDNNDLYREDDDAFYGAGAAAILVGGIIGLVAIAATMAAVW